MERRVKEDIFPELAMVYLSRNYPQRTNNKYYLEQTADTTYYEAKFSQFQDKYSVKFTKQGDLYDVEKTITKNQIPAEVIKKIDLRLDDDFRSYEIQKIQLRDFKSQQQYELVVRGRTPKSIRDYEYKFGENGKFLEKLQIRDRSDDILFLD